VAEEARNVARRQHREAPLDRPADEVARLRIPLRQPVLEPRAVARTVVHGIGSGDERRAALEARAQEVHSRQVVRALPHQERVPCEDARGGLAGPPRRELDQRVEAIQ
jgi:hypothetical protein